MDKALATRCAALLACGALKLPEVACDVAAAACIAADAVESVEDVLATGFVVEVCEPLLVEDELLVASVNV